MAQRLMVARSIMHRPAVLFLDEPTAGLDPQSRLSLWEAVHDLNESGQTILLTTHYMEEADQLCSRVAIMDRGRILALDTPQKLKRSVGGSTEIKVAARGDLDDLAKHLKRKLRSIKSAQVVEDHLVLVMTGANGALPKIVTAAEAGGFTVTDLSATEPTLETVFIGLTGKDLRD
jgi:ABC-2 type transport system ATP-binding protein